MLYQKSECWNKKSETNLKRSRRSPFRYGFLLRQIVIVVGLDVCRDGFANEFR
jgi:hypothetical protein